MDSYHLSLVRTSIAQRKTQMCAKSKALCGVYFVPFLSLPLSLSLTDKRKRGIALKSS